MPGGLVRRPVPGPFPAESAPAGREIPTLLPLSGREGMIPP